MLPGCFDVKLLLAIELSLFWPCSRGAVVDQAATEIDSGYHHIVVGIRSGRGCGLEVYDYVAHSTSVCLPGKYEVYALEVTGTVPCDTVVRV